MRAPHSSGGLNPGGRCTSMAKPTQHGGAPPDDSANRTAAMRTLPPVARSPQGEDTKEEAARRRRAGWGHTKLTIDRISRFGGNRVEK